MRIEDRYALAREMPERYGAANRKGRGELLDAFRPLATSGNVRSRCCGDVSESARWDWPGPAHDATGPVFGRALKVLWEASGYICSERLQPFLPDLVPLLVRHLQLEVNAATRQLLLQATSAYAGGLPTSWS